MDGFARHAGAAPASASLATARAAAETRDARDTRVPLAVATGDAHPRADCPWEPGAEPGARDSLREPSKRQPENPAPTEALQSDRPAAIVTQDATATSDEVVQEPVGRAAFASDVVPAPTRVTENNVQSSDDKDAVNNPDSGPVAKGSAGGGNAPARLPAVLHRHDAAPATTVPTLVPQTPVRGEVAGSDGAQHQPGELHAAPDIKHDFDQVDGHRILRFQPTKEQWDDFPAVLASARSLGADGDGCFKVVIPEGLGDELPERPAQMLLSNAYRVKLMRRTSFWQVSTVPSEGVFASSSRPGAELTEPVDALLKRLKHLFRKHQNRQLRNIRYRVDVPAWTRTQRRLAGVPDRSPIHPLKGDKLDGTRAVIPGIHTPYVYESAAAFGASFQIHAEDFRLASLNHLYRGRKIWIVIPATQVDVAERALGRGPGCSQFMRHRAEFFFPDKLRKLGIPHRIVDQRPGETVVILPDAYHEGFSCGYTIAEARNYADPAWTPDSYQPCQASCRLATAIPAALMRPLGEGEQRLDLCAAYGDGPCLPAPAPVVDAPEPEPGKRETGETDGRGPASTGAGAHEAKRIKMCES
ncbi:Transcription factor jumonji [Metarhizium album ARSEF 1941]|uniref:Transcription factor jumonji n=1 Tax=Metarhizium album (strain ARSEF 1941) TaxID=1081103 RepID=A0A0B2WT76_METAS|nr:Transcription factor jumonji [Metarhizium album ARSEF 1941]KHN96829.1 Transcription factor jumonji [Metarhizium album ARSEF 1941]